MGVEAIKDEEGRTNAQVVADSMAKAEEQNPVLRILKGIERSSLNPSIHGYIVSFTSTTRAKEGSQQTT